MEANTGIVDIDVYTDGACSGNPGPGGWAALILVRNKNGKDDRIVISGGEKHTTNNRMELLAAIKALQFIVKNAVRKEGKKLNVKLYSDSSYVVTSVNNQWIKNWEANGWMTRKRTEVLNRDLWEALFYDCLYNEKAKGFIDFEFIKVKGHSGIEHNEFVDTIAQNESMKFKRLNI